METRGYENHINYANINTNNTGYKNQFYTLNTYFSAHTSFPFFSVISAFRCVPFNIFSSFLSFLACYSPDTHTKKVAADFFSNDSVNSNQDISVLTLPNYPKPFYIPELPNINSISEEINKHKVISSDKSISALPSEPKRQIVTKTKPVILDSPTRPSDNPFHRHTSEPRISSARPPVLSFARDMHSSLQHTATDSLPSSSVRPVHTSHVSRRSAVPFFREEQEDSFPSRSPDIHSRPVSAKQTSSLPHYSPMFARYLNQGRMIPSQETTPPRSHLYSNHTRSLSSTTPRRTSAQSHFPSPPRTHLYDSPKRNLFNTPQTSRRYHFVYEDN